MVVVMMTMALAVGRVTTQTVRTFGPTSWVLTGDAAVVAPGDVVRLAPDRQSKRGGFWSTEPIHFRDWEVTFELRIHGVSQLGADGLAFWYVRNPQRTGDFFGNEFQFTGLGVVIDTYDNDNTGSHPYIFSIWNDGTYTLGDQAHDHVNHAKPDRDAASTPGELNGCHAPRLRNTKERVVMRVRYSDGALSVSYRLPAGNVMMPWDDCLVIPRITLPTGYYIGFTAATGELADDHDIANITVVDLRDSTFSKPFSEAAAPANCPAQPAAPVGSLAELSAKLDGVTDIVRDTLQALAARQPATAPATAVPPANNEQVGQVLTTTRSIQSQMNSVTSQTQEILQLTRQLQAELRSAQTKQTQDKRDEREARVNGIPQQQQRGDSRPFLHTIVFFGLLCCAALAGYFYFQLQRERRRKKLF